MRKSGFTLMELMVYIAILGIVVIVAGQAFSNSTKMRVRTENMIKASASVGELEAFIHDDVAQLGSKSAKESRDYGTSDSFYVSPKVYMDVDNGDMSSFYLENSVSSGDHKDSLAFRRMRYDSQGHYLSVEQVSWYLKKQTLYRKCTTLDYNTSKLSEPPPECPSNGEGAVEMFSNVKSFDVVPAKPAVLASEYSNLANSPRLLPSPNKDDRVFRLISRFDNGNDATKGYKALNRDPQNGGQSVTLFNFASNYNYTDQKMETTWKNVNQVYVASGTSDATENTDSWKTCTKVKLEAHVKYELSFYIPYVSEDKSRSFCPGIDHMAVGFRYAKDGSAVADLNDFSFYPPIDGSANGTRSMQFSLDSTVSDLCLAFTFAMYSPTASNGRITITDLKLNKVEESDYEFDDTLDLTQFDDKQNIRALKFMIRFKEGGEAGILDLVVVTPGNGKKV